MNNQNASANGVLNAIKRNYGSYGFQGRFWGRGQFWGPYKSLSTNNPLERFNRRVKDSFPNPHLNMASFVETIKSISHKYLADYEHIRKGRKRAGVH